jgi:DNA-3-methyladenine glycosylase
MKISPKYGIELARDFFERSADVVAYELLGKLLIRIIDDKPIGGMIVETEAYFGKDDPASRAAKGGKIGSLMYREAGYILVYMVHANWLLNIVTGYREKASAVLIRALEPLVGIEEMIRYRGVDDLYSLTTGPGRLTQALHIDDSLNRYRVNTPDSPIKIIYYLEPEYDEMGRSQRIGVREDLSEPYRFFIKGNPYVSRS